MFNILLHERVYENWTLKMALQPSMFVSLCFLDQIYMVYESKEAGFGDLSDLSFAKFCLEI